MRSLFGPQVQKNLRAHSSPFLRTSATTSTYNATLDLLDGHCQSTIVFRQLATLVNLRSPPQPPGTAKGFRSHQPSFEQRKSRSYKHRLTHPASTTEASIGPPLLPAPANAHASAGDQDAHDRKTDPHPTSHQQKSAPILNTRQQLNLVKATPAATMSASTPTPSSLLNANKVAEPSRYIYVSGVGTPRPLNELRHWFTRGHYIYDELRKPVVPAAVAGAGPDRLATATSECHPRWEDTLPSDPSASAESHLDGGAVAAQNKKLLVSDDDETWLEAQFEEIAALEAALELEKGEREAAAAEEERKREEDRRKAEIKKKTWSGSRGKYGNAMGARPHSFHGKAASDARDFNSHDSVRRQHQHQHQRQIQHPHQHPHQHQHQYQQGTSLTHLDGYGVEMHAGAERHPGYPSANFQPLPTPTMTTTYAQNLGTIPHDGMEPWAWRDSAPNIIPGEGPVMRQTSGELFVPTGLISPRAHDSFDIAMGIIDAHPPPQAVGMPHARQSNGHARKGSMLNPAAGEFCPRAT